MVEVSGLADVYPKCNASAHTAPFLQAYFAAEIHLKRKANLSLRSG